MAVEIIVSKLPAPFSRAEFWGHYFRVYCVARVDDFCLAAFDKLIPAFDRIAEEADHIGGQALLALQSLPFAQQIFFDDPAWFAHEERMAHYYTMRSMRQATLNMIAAGLFHLVEQQQGFFVNTEVPDPAEQKRLRRQGSVFDSAMQQAGINTSDLANASIVSELQLTANAVKHGKGKASAQLVKLRPRLFVSDAMRSVHGDEGAIAQAPIAANVPSSPMAGEYIFVTKGDLERWADGVRAYWKELARRVDILERHSRTGD